MKHYIVTMYGKDVKEVHDKLNKLSAGITGPILSHGNLEVFTHTTSIFSNELLDLLGQSEVEWHLEAIEL